MKKLILFMLLTILSVSASATPFISRGANDSLVIPFFIPDSLGSAVDDAAGDSILIVIASAYGSEIYSDSMLFTDPRITEFVWEDYGNAYVFSDVFTDLDGSSTTEGVYVYSMTIHDQSLGLQHTQTGMLQVVSNEIDLTLGLLRDSLNAVLDTLQLWDTRIDSMEAALADASIGDKTWTDAGTRTLTTADWTTDADLTPIIDTVNAILDTLQDGVNGPDVNATASLSDADMGSIADSVWQALLSQYSAVTGSAGDVLYDSLDALISSAGGTASISDGDMAAIIDTLFNRSKADTVTNTYLSWLITYVDTANFATGTTLLDSVIAVLDTLRDGTAGIDVNLVGIVDQTDTPVDLDNMLDGGNDYTLAIQQLNIQNSAGSGIVSISSSANGHGMYLQSTQAGDGLHALNSGTGSGMRIEAGGTGDNDGLEVIGKNGGAGIDIAGGATGNGLYVAGGSTSGSGIESYSVSGQGLYLHSDNGNAFRALGGGTNHGAWFRGGTFGDGAYFEGGSSAGDGIQATGTGGESDIEADINGSVTDVTTTLNVNTASISAGAIQSTDFQAGAITANAIGTDAITADKIAANAIGASEIATDAITPTEVENSVFEWMYFNIDTTNIDSSALGVWFTNNLSGGAGGGSDTSAIKTMLVNNWTSAASGAGWMNDIADTVNATLTSDHGAGSWQSGAGGSGANTVTIVATDTVGVGAHVAVEMAEVTVTNNATQVLVGSQISDANGETSWLLDNGTYNVQIRKPTGLWDDSLVTVSGAQEDSVYGAITEISSPTGVNTAVVWGYIYDIDGSAAEKAQVTFELPSGTSDTCSNVTFGKYSISTTTNSVGYFEQELIWNSCLEAPWYGVTIKRRGGTSMTYRFTVTSVSTLQFTTEN